MDACEYICMNTKIYWYICIYTVKKYKKRKKQQSKERATCFLKILSIEIKDFSYENRGIRIQRCFLLKIHTEMFPSFT